MNMNYKERVKITAEEMRVTVTPEKPLSAGDFIRAHISVKNTALGIYKLLTMLKWDTNDIAEYLQDEGYLPNEIGSLSDLLDVEKEQSIREDNPEQENDNACSHERVRQSHMLDGGQCLDCGEEL